MDGIATFTSGTITDRFGAAIVIDGAAMDTYGIATFT